MLRNVIRVLALATLFVSATACGGADYNCSHPDIVTAAKELYLVRFTSIELLQYVDREAKPAADKLRTTYREKTKLAAIWTIEKGEFNYSCRAIIETPQLLSSCTDNDDASPACLEQKRQLPPQLRNLLSGLSIAREDNGLVYMVELTDDGSFFMHGWKLETVVADTHRPLPD